MLLSPDPRVVAMWRELACAPSGFAEPGIALVVTDEARFIRPGWCGVVVLGDRAVVVGPAAQHRRLDRLIDATAAPLALTDPIHVEETLRGVEDTLGPADLQYGRVTSSAPSPGLRGPLEYADPLVRRLLEELPPADVSEAGFGDNVASLELGRSLGLDRCGRQFSFLIAQP